MRVYRHPLAGWKIMGPDWWYRWRNERRRRRCAEGRHPRSAIVRPSAYSYQPRPFCSSCLEKL